MANMNVFRVLGDVSHTASKCILIWAILSNKSAEGVSLITQVLYAAVFCTRYLDLSWTPPGKNKWNFVLKIFYISSSFYIIYLMMRVYARTRERERAWKLGAIALGGAMFAAPFVTLIHKGTHGTSVPEVLWSFSIILESVCVLPQLILLRQTTVPTVIDSFYLLTLGSYRGFYILNWITRAARKDPHEPDIVAEIFGIIQTAFYVDFAWVYYTRQRVKLRNGGVVDSDDLSRGWLLSQLFRCNAECLSEEDGTVNDGVPSAAPGTGGRSQGKWGIRGISISADDDADGTWRSDTRAPNDRDAKQLPTDFGEISDDELDEPVAHDPLLSNGGKNVLNEGQK